MSGYVNTAICHLRQKFTLNAIVVRHTKNMHRDNGKQSAKPRLKKYDIVPALSGDKFPHLRFVFGLPRVIVRFSIFVCSYPMQYETFVLECIQSNRIFIARATSRKRRRFSAKDNYRNYKTAKFPYLQRGSFAVFFIICKTLCSTKTNLCKHPN